MITTSFVLKEPASKDKTLILMIARFQGKKITCSLSEKIEPAMWLKKEQRVSKRYFYYKEINQKIATYEAALTTAYYELELRGKAITELKLKEELDFQLGKKPKKQFRTDFIGYYEDYVVNTAPLWNKNQRYYKTALHKMKEFVGKHKYEFEDIDMEFYNRLIIFLQEKGYAANYIGNHIKVLKRIMNVAYESGLHRNDAFKKFKKPSEEIDNIYLPEEEIETIFNLNLTGTQEEIRDLFVLGCWTGLRYGDYSKLSENDIDGNVIRVATEKTEKKVVIPIHKFVREIIKKYGGGFPEGYHINTVNDELKMIGAMAGIKKKITFTRTEGGVRKKHVFRKYEKISTHTARRSFATNMTLKGFEITSIMKITGHKSLKSFFTYLKMSLDENAQKILQHPDFAPVVNEEHPVKKQEKVKVTVNIRRSVSNYIADIDLKMTNLITVKDETLEGVKQKVEEAISLTKKVLSGTKNNTMMWLIDDYYQIVWCINDSVPGVDCKAS